MSDRIAVIVGDGAGPEVIAEARRAVDATRLDVAWHELIRTSTTGLGNAVAERIRG